MNEDKKINSNLQENNQTNWAIGPTTKTKVETRSVISWGVGGKNSSKNTDTSPEVETLFPEDIMDQVNAGTIANKGVSQSEANEELEVLDEDFTSSTKNISSSNSPTTSSKIENSKPRFEPIKQPEPSPRFEPIKQPEPSPRFEPIKQPEPQNNNMAAYIPSTPESTYPNNQNYQQNNNNHTTPNSWMDPSLENPNWMNNQPLSGSKLGVSAITNSAQARDVNQSGKFFNNNRNNQVASQPPSRRLPKTKPVKNRMGLEDQLSPVDENQLLKNFIQSDFSNINRSIFSFPAFFFKGAYLIHRKLFIEGLLIIALDLYVLLFLSMPTSLIKYFATAFILAFAADPIYLFEAKIKVHVIRMMRPNRKKNQGELNRLCMKLGGDALIIALLTEVAFIGCLVYLSMYHFPNSTIHKSYDFVLEFIEKQSKPVYSGAIDRIEINPESYINITIPEEFIRDTGKLYRYLYIPNGREEVKSCAVTISKIDKFTNPEDFLNQYKKVEKIENNVNNITKGDITWYMLDQEMRSFNKHLNVTVIRGQVILFEYNSGYEVEEGICEKYYNDIFDSISLKK